MVLKSRRFLVEAILSFTLAELVSVLLFEYIL